MGSLGKFVLFAAMFTASSMFGQQDSAPPPDNSSQSQPAQPQNQSQPENQPQNQSQPPSPDQTQPAPPQTEPSQPQSQPSTPQTEPVQQQPSTQVPAQQENKPPVGQENKPATKPSAAHHTTHKTTAKKTTKSAPSSTKKSKQSASTKKPATKGPTIIVDPTGKVVVRNGGATADPVEISPGVTKEQEVRDRENIEQLLATTETNLKSVEGRQLTPAQQSSLDQIRAYVRQAKAASAAGDTTRARTLASKANLLAVELAKK